MHSRTLFALAAVMMSLVAADSASSQSQPPPSPDSRALLLSALGTATIECLGTVGPDTFSTSTGFLERTFRSCPVDGEALTRIDALLGVQHSEQGRVDDLGGYYTGTWNAFVESFPRRVRTCPNWTLLNVIDAPTTESVARIMREGRPGKENRRYAITAPDGQTSSSAVDQAVVCAGGFGEGFIVYADGPRGTIEVDPAWWLLDYEYTGEERGPCTPFPFDEGYSHGYCDSLGTPIGTLYGAIEREGERCCAWKDGELVSDDGVFVPIDCDGEGWYCMTYCEYTPDVKWEPSTP